MTGRIVFGEVSFRFHNHATCFEPTATTDKPFSDQLAGHRRGRSLIKGTRDQGTFNPFEGNNSTAGVVWHATKLNWGFPIASLTKLYERTIAR